MNEGLLALFECIKQDFLSLSLDDFTQKAQSESQKLEIWSAVSGSPLENDWKPFYDAKNSVINIGYPRALREAAYDRLKYNVEGVIAKIKSGSVSVPKKRIAEEIVNMITDPKIRQICLEINTTPDQNVLSLMQSLGEAVQWTLWYQGYCAQKIGTKIKSVKSLTLNDILDEATDKNRPFYIDNAANRFLNEFHKNFMKTYYDMVRHDSAYIPDIIVINPALVSLEHLLKVTFS